MELKEGQKVETPFGPAEIVFLHDIPIKWARVKIPNNHEWLYSFNVDDLKPYKNANDKLLDLGFKLDLKNEHYIVYSNQTLDCTIHIDLITKEYGVYHYSDNTSFRFFNSEIVAILYQYSKEIAL